MAIRAKKVLCIDKDNNNLGVMNFSEALSLANQDELDLMQISIKDNLPTCKILNYSKFKYEQSKKQKEVAKKQRESTAKIKEIKLRPSTSENDLRIKANKVSGFLDEGNKVKITVTFKGREISHKNLGIQTLNVFMAMLSNITIIDQLSSEGKMLSLTCFRKKNVDDNCEQ